MRDPGQEKVRRSLFQKHTLQWSRGWISRCCEFFSCMPQAVQAPSEFQLYLNVCSKQSDCFDNGSLLMNVDVYLVSAVLLWWTWRILPRMCALMSMALLWSWTGQSLCACDNDLSGELIEEGVRQPPACLLSCVYSAPGSLQCFTHQTCMHVCNSKISSRITFENS